MPPDLTALDWLSTAVVLAGPDRRLLTANAAAEHLFGLARERLAGRPWEEIFGDSPTLRTALDEAERNRWFYACHGIGLHLPSGQTLAADVTVSPIQDDGEGFTLEFRPIDQRLKTTQEEERLRLQQAARELVRALAHEIKNPLGGIRGAAQLLQMELPDPALAEYTEVIILETDRLQRLLAGLLAAHQAPRPAPVNVHEILEHVRRLLLAEFPTLRVERDYDTSLPELTADRERLLQAILNIARNAAQATGGKGKVELRTRAARQVTLAKRRYRLAAHVEIADDGPGIPEALRERIFYPLVSGREGGAGLGLAIAQDIVAQHHGVIEFDSRPGRTRFHLLLPLTAGSPT